MLKLNLLFLACVRYVTVFGFFSELSGLPLKILFRLNFKTDHVTCHISLPF